MIIYWKKKVDILNRPVLKLWPLILPFILSVPFYLYLTMPIKEGAYASYAERLLEQKYSEKFEISNMRFPIESITGLLINTYPFSYFYNFYPVNNPDLKTHGIISPYRGSDECIDGYGILVACTEMKAMIKPYIDKIADNNYYEVLLQPKYYNKEKGKIIWDKKVADELYLLKIPLKKVLKDKKGKFFISLQVYYAYDITDGNKEKVFKDVYSLYHFLEENGVNTVHMSIKFFSRKKFNDEPIYNYYKKTPNSFSYKYRPYNNIYMTYDNMNTVNSYKDIAEYFNMPLDIKYRNKLKK